MFRKNGEKYHCGDGAAHEEGSISREVTGQEVTGRESQLRQNLSGSNRPRNGEEMAKNAVFDQNGAKMVSGAPLSGASGESGQSGSDAVFHADHESDARKNQKLKLVAEIKYLYDLYCAKKAKMACGAPVANSKNSTTVVESQLGSTNDFSSGNSAIKSETGVQKIISGDNFARMAHFKSGVQSGEDGLPELRDRSGNVDPGPNNATEPVIKAQKILAQSGNFLQNDRN